MQCACDNEDNIGDSLIGMLPNWDRTPWHPISDGCYHQKCVNVCAKYGYAIIIQSAFFGSLRCVTQRVCWKPAAIMQSLKILCGEQNGILQAPLSLSASIFAQETMLDIPSGSQTRQLTISIINYDKNKNYI